VALRGYQQRAVQQAAQGSNLILVCPTGSGKTAIAVAHAESVLRRDAAARIVFLAPTVPLVQQQTGGDEPVAYGGQATAAAGSTVAV
jgi:ERCC4-related helicase